jgi:hypothetical protein
MHGILTVSVKTCIAVKITLVFTDLEQLRVVC